MKTYSLSAVVISAVCTLLANSQRWQNPDIRVPPAIVQQSTDLYRILLEGQDTEITCQASGYPEPHYTWEFNGVPIDSNDPNIEVHGTSLKVAVSPINEGAYQCIAANAYGKTMTDITYLRRAFLGSFPPFIPDREYMADAGQALIMQCTRTRSLPDSISAWQTVSGRGDHPLPETVNLDKRIQQDDQGNLYFAYVKKSDELYERYKCSLTNVALGQTVFGSYSKIRINGDDANVPNQRPAIMFYSGFLVEANPIIALRDGEIKLRCLFAGKPVPDVSWAKDGGTLPAGRVHYEQYDTVLKIRNVHDDDEGTYVCTGNNVAGTDLMRISVNVESVPVFTSVENEPTNQNVTEGQDAVFRCDAEAVPPATAQWYINGEMISETNRPARVNFEENGRVIRVRNVCKNCPLSLSDLKVYQCNSSNTHGYLFRSAYLNVLEPTTLERAPFDVDLVYREVVRFECHGRSDDSTPITITWLKDGQQIAYIPGEIETENDGSLLKITTENLPESGLEYVGNYTCVISNGYSKVNAMASLIKPKDLSTEDPHEGLYSTTDLHTEVPQEKPYSTMHLPTEDLQDGPHSTMYVLTEDPQEGAHSTIIIAVVVTVVLVVIIVVSAYFLRLAIKKRKIAKSLSIRRHQPSRPNTADVKV